MFFFFLGGGEPWRRLNDTINIEGEPSGLQIVKERAPKATLSQEDSRQFGTVDDHAATKHEGQNSWFFAHAHMLILLLGAL